MNIVKRTPRKTPVSRWWLPGLLSLALCAPVPAICASAIETGFSPEGTALQLVLKTIDSAQQEIRLMGYAFTSPEVASALVRAKRRGVDVKVVLDWKANSEENNKASRAAMNLLVNAGILVRTVSQFKIMHDKVIITDGRNVETGSFNYTRAAARSNSENVLVIRDNPALAETYLQHWQSRWEMGTGWELAY
ncbi:phospholipase D family protein [Klebsiella sp. NPDC088457]